MTTESPSSLALRIAALGGSAWLAGNISTFSLIAVPAVLQTHRDDSVTTRPLSRVWKHMYDKGAAQNPPVAIGIASIYAYLAWQADTDVLRYGGIASQRHLYLASIALTMGIVPWTLIVMTRTNGKLHVKANKAVSAKTEPSQWTAGDEKEVGDLLGTWVTLNGIRALFPLLGFVAGAVAALS